MHLRVIYRVMTDEVKVLNNLYEKKKPLIFNNQIIGLISNKLAENL